MKTIKTAVSLFTAVLMGTLVNSAYAAPTGGQVVGGSATITQKGNRTNIKQSSGSAIINWNDFSIAQNEVVYFNQGANGIALNRVIGNNASIINGKLKATGKIILVNQAGIVFGESARVDVGGLIATTASIKNSDFMAGRYHFEQTPNSTGSVINRGRITVRKSGLAALVAPEVANHGVIKAKLGKIALASGHKFTVDFYGDSLIHFALENHAGGSVTNTGRLVANGGKVLMTAQTAVGVLDNVINMSGVIAANTVDTRQGVIVLGTNTNNGVVNITGKINAKGDKNEKGGRVSILAHKVNMSKSARINVKGKVKNGRVNIYHRPENFIDPETFSKNVKGNLKEFIWVNNVSDLQTIDINSDTRRRNYAMWQDIDAKGFDFDPISTYSGNFNGRFYAIKNLKIDADNAALVGMFGTLMSDSKIRNLGLEKVDVAGDYGVGALAGLNLGKIRKVYATGHVNGVALVGGLVGVNLGKVNNAYTHVNVSGQLATGGFVGLNWGKIKKAYSTGLVNGSLLSGGFAGVNLGKIRKSYWNTETSGLASGVGFGSNHGLFGKTTAEMMQRDTYKKWNFNKIWAIDEGSATPYFKKRYMRLAHNGDDEQQHYVSLTASDDVDPDGYLYLVAEDESEFPEVTIDNVVDAVQQRNQRVAASCEQGAGAFCQVVKINDLTNLLSSV